MRRFSGKKLLSALCVAATLPQRDGSALAVALTFPRAVNSNSSPASTPSATEAVTAAAMEGERQSAVSSPPSSSPFTATAGRRKSGATFQHQYQQHQQSPRRHRSDRRPSGTTSNGDGRATPTMARRSTRHHTSTTQTSAALICGAASPPMRRRRSRERKPRKPQSKEALLLQALATVDDVARGRNVVPLHTKARSITEREGELDGAVPDTTPAATRFPGSNAAPAAVSSDRLLTQVSVRNFIAKLQSQLSAVTVPLRGWWTRGPSDSTLRHMERQLELVIRQSSFDAYATLHESMRRRFEDPLMTAMGRPRATTAAATPGSGGGAVPEACCGSERLLLLYARLLVNYGTFCLLNSDPQRAISLLREAIATAEAVSSAAAGEEVGSTEVGGSYGGTSMLYTRVLLANALSCERLYWQAAEQYIAALQGLAENPCDFPLTSSDATGHAAAALAQMSPGTSAFLPLSRQCIQEDAKGFFQDTARLRKALSQGQAHELLLQSQGASPAALSQLRLTMARLYRLGSAHCVATKTALRPPSMTAAAMLQKSRELYEAYLDDLVSREEEDTQHAMLELGRMLCENPAIAAGEGTSMNDTDALSRQLEAGLVYVEAASEVFLEEAELALSPGKQLTHAQKQFVVRAASVLVDAAEAHVRGENEAAALGLYEGSLDLMNRADMRELSAWILQRYADTLSSVSFVDKAILKYTTAMEVLRANEHYGIRGEEGDASGGSADEALRDTTSPLLVVESGAPLQLGPGQRFVSLTSVDVEASLAYCYQVYVGDPRRAVWHYEHVLDSILSAGKHATNGAVAASTVPTPTPSFPSPSPAKGRRRRAIPIRTEAPIFSVMTMEREHYVLTNMVACCERVQDWDSAIAAQNRLIAIEAVLGDYAVAACLRSVALMEMKADYTTMLGVLFYLLLLPAEDMEVSARLTVAHYFVKCCYALGNQTMGSILLNAVRQVEGDHNPTVVLHWAVNAEKLDASEKLTVYDAVDMRADIKTIADTFLRAAQLLVAHRVSDNADKTDDEQRRSASVYPRTADADNDDADADDHHNSTTITTATTKDTGVLAAKPRTLSMSFLTSERDSLVVLSRGAFYFHQNGHIRQAEELYAAAVRFADEARIPQDDTAEGLPAEVAERHSEYNRELAILLANYATLKLSTDPAEAEKLYTRAAAIRPAPLEVAEVVADYFVQSGNYAKGATHMARVIEAHPESAAEMHGRVARLGCGQPWPFLTAAQRLEVHEHLVLALGVDPALVPKHAADSRTTEANFSERMRALDALTLQGVSTTAGDEAACLACFLLQTKYGDKAHLINQLYKQALKRFPFHTAILVNYAKFCCDYNFHALARKLYARAYGAADGDFCRTLCYVNYLSHAFGQEQVAAGEALYRCQLEREPQSSQAHMHYANYLAVMIPTPHLAETHFQRGVALDPQSKLLGLYAQFVWSCADNPVAHQKRDIRTQLFDKAEALFKRAVDIEPENPLALQNLGTFYANRHNRFEEAVQTLYKAHKLAPNNVEVTRQLGSVLFEECVRVQGEGQQRYRAAAKQGVPPHQTSASLTPMSPRLRSLVESTQQVFDKSIELDPTHRETLEKYATFAVTVLKNPSLAAELWTRINRLGSK